MYIETATHPVNVDISIDDLYPLIQNGQFGSYVCLNLSHDEFVVASTESTQDVAPETAGHTAGYRFEYWFESERQVLRGRASLTEVIHLMLGFAQRTPDWRAGFEWVQLEP